MDLLRVRITALCVCWSALLSAGAAKEQQEKPSKSKFKLSAVEQKVLDLTNAERKKHDLPPLRLSPRLSKVARAHSANMAKQRKMSHILDEKNPADRVKAAGYPFGYIGENVGAGARQVDDMMKAWMNSKHHRENILNKNFTEIGIGVVRDGRRTPYYTQVFTSRKGRR
jgi:uncharacterized protein YkwD